jgi:phosphoglycerate dehydrogenase-like enzyme
VRVAFGGRIARDQVVKRLGAMPGIEFTAVGPLTELVPLIPDTEVLIISDPRGDEGPALGAALRDPSSKVRWIQVVSAGVDGLTAHAIPPSIRITNQGGAVAPMVAEHAMAMMLSYTRQTGPIYERSQRGVWDRDFTPMPFGVEGRTMCIVGMGNVGVHLAKRAKAFDMDVIGVSRSGAATPPADRMYALTALHEALAAADVTVICLALARETANMFDAKMIAAMKAGSMLINVSRGETVDQTALRAALVDGHLGAAAIDVTTPEPLPAGDPLWSAPNLVISPHMAGGGGKFTSQRIADTVVENLARYTSGRDLLHLVSG